MAETSKITSLQKTLKRRKSPYICQKCLYKAVFSCYIFTWTDRLGGIEWDLSLSPVTVLIPDPRQLPILHAIIDTICPIHKLRLLTSSSIRSKHIITDFPFIVTTDMYSVERQVWATWDPGEHNNGHTLEFLITICKLFKSAGDIIFKIQWQGSEVLYWCYVHLLLCLKLRTICSDFFFQNETVSSNSPN